MLFYLFAGSREKYVNKYYVSTDEISALNKFSGRPANSTNQSQAVLVVNLGVFTTLPRIAPSWPTADALRNDIGKT